MEKLRWERARGEMISTTQTFKAFTRAIAIEIKEPASNEHDR